MIGRELDQRYRILGKLGEGGWAEVYLVEHINLGRKEALKVLLPDLGGTPKLLARFRREARATNRLQHPNIIRVHDFGQLPDGRFYLTTEYAEGEALDAAIARVFRFPVPAALNLLAQLADAVDHAHSRGVIHRDLKPGNLILVKRHRNSYQLKVLDFGIAKIIAPDYQDSLVKTRQGEIFGTPAYMAPEQVRGEAVDGRADIYAIGCIAHELVTGSPPFWGRSVEVMNAHMSEPAKPPGGLRPEAQIPLEFDALVLRCLEKQPDRRFQSGRELLAAIKQVPGFGNAKTGSGRRSYHHIPTGQLPPVPKTGGFEDVETEEGATDHHVQATRRSFFQVDTAAETRAISPADARVIVQAISRALAEALIDQGCRDFGLSVGVANIASVEGAVERIGAQMDDLEEQSDAAEQRGREHESTLRFAMGELRFELEQARAHGQPIDHDVEEQVAELERRVGEVNAEVDREIVDITERAIALAADKGSKEEELDELYQALDRLLDEIAPKFASNKYIAELFSRLVRARATYDLAEHAAPVER